MRSRLPAALTATILAYSRPQRQGGPASATAVQGLRATAPAATAVQGLCAISLDRRSAAGLGASAAATALLLPLPAPAAELPPAAVILRVAEVTQFQEDALRRAASYSDEEERERAGYAFGRNQMEMSVDVLLRNTRLSSLPGCATPALTIGEVKRIASRRDGMLSQADLLAMAAAYSRSREELRVAFEAMPERERREGKEIVRGLKAADDERKRAAQAEEEAAIAERGLYPR
jgi:hypothetical protein